MASERSFSVNQITITEGEEEDFGVLEESRLEQSTSKFKLQEDQAVREASRKIRWASIALVTYLILAGVGCAIGTAWSIRRREGDDYEESFYTAASTLADALPRDLQRMLWSLQVLAQDLQTESQQLNMTWPYVTISSFHTKAATINELLGAKQLTLLPVVRDTATWEKYAKLYGTQEGGNGIDESLEDSFMAHGMHDAPGSSQETLTNEGIVLPAWQSFPIDQSSTGADLNADWLSLASLAPSLEYVLESKQPAVSPLHQNSIEYLSVQWQSTLLYPVVESDGNVVAVLAGTFDWVDKVHDNTPLTGSTLMETVVHSSCSSDNDDRQDTLLLLTTVGNKLIDVAPSHDFQVPVSFSGLLGESAPCQTVLEILSIDEEEKREYRSIAPLWSGIICLGIFLMALTLYALVYSFVHARHLLVLKQNAKSSALVSSLFPNNFRDRIMSNMMDSRGVLSHISEATGETTALEDSKATGLSVSPESNETSERSDSLGKTRELPKMRLKSYLRENSKPGESIINAKPIADFFPNCTVLFADICGFTGKSNALASSTIPESSLTLFRKLLWLRSMVISARARPGVYTSTESLCRL